MTEYVLMHKDVRACKVLFNSTLENIIDIVIITPEHMPISVNDSKTFADWWQRRAVPSQQTGKEILLNGITRMQYLVQNLGLSLTDHYWICPIGSQIEWHNVNLYENNFMEMDCDNNDYEPEVSYKPSSSTQGELQKRWMIFSGKRCLIKGNSSAMCRQSINEVFATRLHEMQKKPHTAYSLIELPFGMGGGIGCISENFTNSTVEFVPCYDIVSIKKKKNDVSMFEHYVQCCLNIGLDIREYLDYQILTDFLLTNVDRHLLNLGCLRNSETLEFVGPAPIYDTGNSMFFNQDYNEKTVRSIKINSFASMEIQMLQYVQNKDAVDLGHVPDSDLMNKLYTKDKYSIVYLDNMRRGYEKKIEMLKIFQSGGTLNPRHVDVSPEIMKI